MYNNLIWLTLIYVFLERKRPDSDPDVLKECRDLGHLYLPKHIIAKISKIGHFCKERVSNFGLIGHFYNHWFYMANNIASLYSTTDWITWVNLIQTERILRRSTDCLDKFIIDTNQIIMLLFEIQLSAEYLCYEMNVFAYQFALVCCTLLHHYTYCPPSIILLTNKEKKAVNTCFC